MVEVLVAADPRAVVVRELVGDAVAAAPTASPIGADALGSTTVSSRTPSSGATIGGPVERTLASRAGILSLQIVMGPEFLDS